MKRLTTLKKNGVCKMIDYDDNKYSDNHISEFLLFYIVASHENQILNKRNQLLASKLKRMCLARYGAIAGNAIFEQIMYNVDVEDFLKDYLRR